MPTSAHILASGGEDLIVKVVIFLIIAVIWAVSQAIGWLTGKKDKRLPPSRPRPQPLPQRPPVAVPAPPTLQRRSPQQAPVLKRPPAVKVPRKPKPRPAPVPVPTPIAAPVAYEVRTPQRVQSESTQAYEPPPNRDDVLPRRQVVDALLRPRNLRKAFIVTELLGPPMALRPEASADR